MDAQHLLAQISKLPDKGKEEALLFVEFLMSKYQVKPAPNEKRKGFGSSPGIQMTDDFDDELEDFKEYMPE